MFRAHGLCSTLQRYTSDTEAVGADRPQVVRKLLRAGAHVVLTSRFPVDAARRVAAAAAAEPGGGGTGWSERCAVYGLDLRDMQVPCVTTPCPDRVE